MIRQPITSSHPQIENTSIIKTRRRHICKIANTKLSTFSRLNEKSPKLNTPAKNTRPGRTVIIVALKNRFGPAVGIGCSEKRTASQMRIG